MSDSLQLTDCSLLDSCQWNSLGKSPGVGSYVLLPGDHPDPGTEPGSPALQADSLPPEPPAKPLLGGTDTYLPLIIDTLMLTHSPCLGVV